MGRDPFGHAPLDPKSSLHANRQIEKQTLRFPRKRKSHREPLGIQTSDSPRHILGCHAFNEIRRRVRIQKRPQLACGLERQAGSRRKENMPNLGKLVQHRLGRCKRCIHKRPCPPFTAPLLDEAHMVKARHGIFQTLDFLRVGRLVDVKHNGTALGRPIRRHLTGALEPSMGHYDKANAQAQLPLDIRPSTSSCRQLMYFSENWHHSVRPSVSCSYARYSLAPE